MDRKILRKLSLALTGSRFFGTYRQVFGFLGAGKGRYTGTLLRPGQWFEAEGADAIHVSGGSSFPHPCNPAGGAMHHWDEEEPNDSVA